MLTSAPGELVKETKRGKICFEKSIFYILKRYIRQVPMPFYYIKLLNRLYLAFSL
jgi:hypothetical protein